MRMYSGHEGRDNPEEMREWGEKNEGAKYMYAKMEVIRKDLRGTFA